MEQIEGTFEYLNEHGEITRRRLTVPRKAHWPRPLDEGNCNTCGGRVMWGDCADGCHAASQR